MRESGRRRCRHGVSSSSLLLLLLALARIQVKSRLFSVPFFSFCARLSVHPLDTSGARMLQQYCRCIAPMIIIPDRSFSCCAFVVDGYCMRASRRSASSSLSHVTSAPHAHTHTHTQRQRVKERFSRFLSFTLSCVAFGACFCCLQKWPNHSSFRCVRIRAAQAHSPSPPHAPERFTTEVNIKRSNSTNEF